MPGTFRDDRTVHYDTSPCHKHGKLCQRDEKSWQTAWVHIYQATGGARRDGSPCMGTR